MDAVIFAGFDVGSRTTKLVAMRDNKIIDSKVTESGMEPQKKVFELWHELQNKFSKTDFKVVSTGYGRNLVTFADKIISEIGCQAKGVHYLFPEARTIIDIGGQDSKIILKNHVGKVVDFVMNDKCAAGTGRFLEMAATIFGVSVSELGNLALQSSESVKIDNTCVVFAESEIISLIASQQKRENIIAGVHSSIAHRIKSMTAALPWEKPLVFTGGVAHNSGMIHAIGKMFQTQPLIPPESSITGAIGAALFASELI
jgi:predicted CoA-substrate-specific enzyme activase